MKMIAGIAVVAMPVSLGLQRDRDKTHLAVGDAALGDDGFGKVTHRHRFSPEHSHLETVLMVEMHMHGRNMEVMVIVMRGCEPFRQFAGVMVEYIRERGKALCFGILIQARVLQAETGEIP